VNKYTYAALALIVAVPGGFLCYLLVMAMLNDFPQMVVMMRVLACTMLAFSALATVLPVGILIFVKDEKEEAGNDEDVEDVEDVEGAGEDMAPVEMSPAADEAVHEAVPGDEVEMTDTGQQEPLDEFPPEAGEQVDPGDTEQSVVMETDFGDEEFDVTDDDEFEFTDEEEPDEKP